MTAPFDFEDDPRWRSPRRSTGCALCQAAQPEGVLDGREPCASCGATTCEGCGTPCRACELLARLRAVCAGDSEAALSQSTPSDAKLFYIVRTFGDARDVLFAPDRVEMRVPGDPRRHSYYPHAAPYALARILRDTGVTHLAQPLVAHAAAGSTWRTVGRSSRDEIAWLLPLARGIEVRFRPPPRDGMPPVPQAIPAEGPWALPPPWTSPPWAPPARLEVHGEGVACPHCTRSSPRYRAIDDTCFVCAPCGRSFTSAVLAQRVARGP